MLMDNTNLLYSGTDVVDVSVVSFRGAYVSPICTEILLVSFIGGKHPLTLELQPTRSHFLHYRRDSPGMIGPFGVHTTCEKCCYFRNARIYVDEGFVCH